MKNKQIKNKQMNILMNNTNNYYYRYDLVSASTSLYKYSPRTFSVVTSTNPQYRITSDNHRRYFVSAPSLCYDSIYSNNEYFYNTIPCVYISSKNKPILVYFNINELSSYSFIHKLPFVLSKDSLYTFFIKVRYNFDSFFMVGNQFGFSYWSKQDIYNLFN